MKTTYRVDLEPVGRRIEVEEGVSLLSAAQWAGVDLAAVCGGVGICGACRVRLLEGHLTPAAVGEKEIFSAEELAAGWRLACQAALLSDVRIDIPSESLTATQRLQVDGLSGEEGGRQRPLDPLVRALDVELAYPTLQDLVSDLNRLRRAGAGNLQVDFPMLEHLSTRLRKQAWKARLAVRDTGTGGTELAGVLPAGSDLLGLAVDVGSTKLALYLVSLVTGATLAQRGVMNPQIGFGEDVVSRIAFANHSPENRRLLQTRLVEMLNQTLQALCSEARVSEEMVVDAVMVGNTVMHHCLLHLPLEQLGASPYVAAVSEALCVPASTLRLAMSAGAQVYLPPNIAGYVGADHTAALLAAHMEQGGGPTVLVDIGTNTEISLAHAGRILSCSTASGPAFEGAHIHDGMRAAPGAIERVRILDGQVTLSTVGGALPVGICGTGILSAIAEMRAAGLVDHRGAMLSLTPGAARPTEFVLCPAGESGHGRAVVVTRRDISEIQLAKGAIRTGIDVLLERAEVKAQEVQRWVIAGAFGTYLDLQSAMRIGMFPQVPLERFEQVGNAAGMGARQMLLSRRSRAEAERLAEKVEYIELTTYRKFTEKFADSMAL
jgi:uncharacterized 2Fe-2S/4Fe-4S cluster protein (DUF4445 family)